MRARVHNTEEIVLSLRLARELFPICALLCLCGMASGKEYPNKPVRIVTVEPGGSTDFAARLIARGLTDSFGQQVIVENRGGANGIVAMVAAMKATPDGYTLLVNSGGTWTLPLVQEVPHDPVKDFAPARTPALLLDRLNREIVRVVQRSDAKETFANAGSEAVGSSCEQLAATMKSEMARLDKVIMQAGIRAE